MTSSEAREEIDKAWRGSYSAARNEQVIDSMRVQSLETRAMHFFSRLCFRGIYVPQLTKTAWLSLILQNRRSIFKLLRAAAAKYSEAKIANRTRAAATMR
jgi:hypothetical protein